MRKFLRQIIKFFNYNFHILEPVKRFILITKLLSSRFLSTSEPKICATYRGIRRVWNTLNQKEGSKGPRPQNFVKFGTLNTF